MPLRLVLVSVLTLVSTLRADPIPNFETSPYFNEQLLSLNLLTDIKVLINAPSAEKFDPAKPTDLVIYSLPNGNSIEQTLGCQLAPGMDWHYNIQHIAAQTRK